MPPQSTGGGVAGAPSGGLTRPVMRTMPEDLRRLGGSSQSVTGSGKVMWPSGTAPTEAPTKTSTPATKGGFLSSLLQSKHHDDGAVPPLPPTSTQKIAVHGEDNKKSTPSVWDARVPSVVSPRSSLPIPQRPIVMPITAQPPRPPSGVSPIYPSVPPPASPATLPKPAPAPSSVVAPGPTPVVPPKIVISSPSTTPTRPATSQFMDAGMKAPSAAPPSAAPIPTPRPLPRPTTPPPAPRVITSVSTPRPSVPVSDEDVGIDLGISDYLKGGPTFQIDKTHAPIPTQPIRPDTRPSQQSGSSTPTVGGIWNPPKMTPPIERTRVITPSSAGVVTPPSATIFAPPTAPSSQAAVPQYASPKPTQSNADLDAEKQRMAGERAQIAGAKSAVEASIRSLINDKNQADNQIKPILLRETELAREIEELERKEQGLVGEVRRTIERDRWTKVEERRKVEQERMLMKRRLVSVESDIHGKEEEQVSLVKREKDIDARIVWIDAEYKRRDARMRLAEVNQEKTKVESHRSILDNGLKRLKASLEETERNERRLMELKRSLAIKMPQNIAEEEKYAQERFDIEKQMHDMELRRWSLEDELKNATELFAKEDMAYLDVMHRAESLEGELKAIG